MRTTSHFIIYAISAVMLSSLVWAQADADISIYGFELEKLLNLGSGILALALLAITYAAYRRNHNKRLLYISVAFLLFALKGFITSLELIGLDLLWPDPVSSVLNFAILLSFFFGVIKRQ